MLRLPLYLLAIGCVISSANSAAQADASGQFYEKDAAKSIFGPDVVVVPKPKVDPQADQFKPGDPKDPKSKIIKEFGDPKEDHPVLAIESAPKPFKGLMQSLQEGQEELAYEYAKQYARYLRDFRERTLRVTGLTKLAMVSEGELSHNQLAGSSLVQNDLHLLQDDLDRQSEGQRSMLKTVDPKVLALITKAAEEEDGAGVTAVAAELDPNAPAPGITLGEFEANERAAARRALQGRALPAGRGGKIEVYFFFRRSDDRALQMAAAIEALQQAAIENENLAVSGQLMEIVADSEIALVKSRYGISFPIESGTRIARELGVNRSPTTAFTSSATGQAVIEEGARSFYYLDEILRQISGGAQG